MKGLLTLLLLACAICGSGQNTYLGKRFTATLGTALNFPTNNRIIFHNSGVSNTYEWSMFPPKFEANIGFALHKAISINFFGSFHGIQNTGLEVNTYDYDNPAYSSLVLTDRFKFKTNSYGLGLEVRIFSEVAPIGRYVFIGGQYNTSYTDVFPTYISEKVDLNYETVVITDRRQPGLLISNDIGVTFGFGRNRLLSRLFSLDYGLRSTLFMRDRNAHSITRDNYKDNFHDIVDRIALVNLQSSSYIEIYLRFGFSK